LLLAVSFCFLIGCGSGSTSSTPMASSAPSGPPGPGGPPPGPGGGYGDGSGNGYGANTGYGDNTGYGSSNTGYGDNTGYGSSNNGYGPAAASGYPEEGNNDSAAAESASGGAASPSSPGNPEEAAAASANNGYGNGYGGSGGINPADRPTDPYAAVASNDSGPPTGGGGISYERDVKPIFERRCYGCHGPGERANKGKLRLHDPEEIANANVIEKNRPDRSELMSRIQEEPGSKFIMPPQGPPLETQQIAIIRDWIQQGASFTESASAVASSGYGGYGSSPTTGNGPQDGAPLAREPQTYAEHARAELQRGNDRLGMNYLFASVIAADEGSAELVGQYRWVKRLKRPVLGVRWGLGVEFTKRGRFEGDPMPIGRWQSLPSRGGESSTGGGSSGPPDLARSEDLPFANEALDYYAGVVADRVIDRLEMRHTQKGYFGKPLQDAVAAAASGEDGFGGSDDGYDTPRAGVSRGVVSGNGYGGTGYGGGGRGGSGGGEEEPEDRIASIMPGVTMLGKGTKAQLLEKARARDIDVLLMIEVDAERNVRTDLVYSTTKVRLVDIATEETVAVTRGMKNIDVQRAMEADPNDETIDLELDKIFAEAADKDYVVTEIPAGLTTKPVLGRLGQVIKAKHANPLSDLAEVKFYRARDLITDDHVKKAFELLAGPTNAAKLLGDSSDDKKAVLETWLAPLRESAVRGSAGSGEDDGGARDDDDDRQRSRREFR
jgi:hypothetical protein